MKAVSYTHLSVHIFMILNINSILNKLNVTDKGRITGLLDKVTSKTNVKIIVVDTIDNIKTISYEPLFKTNVSLSE